MGYINRLFFRKDTGTLIYRYSMQGDIVVSTIEQDLQAIVPLQDYDVDSIEVIEISQNDIEIIEKINMCTGVRLDTSTKELIFDFTPQQIEEIQRQATLEERLNLMQKALDDLILGGI